MRLDPIKEKARDGALYPGLILHGGDSEERIAAGVELARTLLCELEPAQRPCGKCKHCRRIEGPGEGDRFHPDFLVLERDLKTSTSADAARGLIRSIQQSPFEARGQVLMITSAESLTGGAANALLKSLEEPPDSAPRHFLLLAPSATDLLPTLRSRCLSIYLGLNEAGAVDEETVERLVQVVEEWLRLRSSVFVLSFAASLLALGHWEDPRSGEPWSVASAVVLAAARRCGHPAMRRSLLGLAEELLEGPDLRSRGITAQRILEGWVARSFSRVPG